MRKHIRVVAAAVFHEGEWLCLRKGTTPHPYTSGRWEFPGGKIESGETEPQALCRELREEMDYEVCVGPLLARIDYAYPDFDLTLALYRCTPASSVAPQAFSRKEHTDHCWLPASRLAELDWMPADLDLLPVLVSASALEQPCTDSPEA